MILVTSLKGKKKTSVGTSRTCSCGCLEDVQWCSHPSPTCHVTVRPLYSTSNRLRLPRQMINLCALYTNVSCRWWSLPLGWPGCCWWRSAIRDSSSMSWTRAPELFFKTSQVLWNKGCIKKAKQNNMMCCWSESEIKSIYSCSKRPQLKVGWKDGIIASGWT